MCRTSDFATLWALVRHITQYWVCTLHSPSHTPLTQKGVAFSPFLPVGRTSVCTCVDCLCLPSKKLSTFHQDGCLKVMAPQTETIENFKTISGKKYKLIQRTFSKKKPIKKIDTSKQIDQRDIHHVYYKASDLNCVDCVK